MSYFVTLTNDNRVSGVYSDENNNVPDVATQISDNDFALIHTSDNLGHSSFIKGKIVVDSEAIRSALFDKLKTKWEAEVHALLDTSVNRRGYRDMNSCLSYAYSSNATFKNEALSAGEWRDAVWLAYFEQLELIASGASETFDMEKLPELVW